MSTRANVILKEGDYELIFYRHHDGYPDWTLPSLEKFVDWMKTHRIRDNIVQASGWLILLGATVLEPPAGPSDRGWSCGEYQPTTAIHGDIQYLYVVDLEKKTIHIDGQEGYRYNGKFRDLDDEDE